MNTLLSGGYVIATRDLTVAAFDPDAFRVELPYPPAHTSTVIGHCDVWADDPDRKRVYLASVLADGSLRFHDARMPRSVPAEVHAYLAYRPEDAA